MSWLLFLLICIAYFIAIALVGRAWRDGRISARRAGTLSGLALVLTIGGPIAMGAVRRGDDPTIALLMLGLLAIFVIPMNVGLMGWAERHGVLEELQRLAARRRKPK
jgi:hypothetical protein